LKDHIKDEIARIKRLEELAEMINTAIRIDNRVYERQMERTRGRAPFQPRYKANTSRFKKPSQGLYPREMDLDATQHRKKDSHPRRKGGLTKAQREERMKKNLCLYCGKPGHRAKKCPNKQHLHATQGAPEVKTLAKENTKWKVTSNVEPDGSWDARVAVTLEPSDLDISPPAQELMDKRKHAYLSWTGCYDDSCTIHQLDKDATGWYPKKPRSKAKGGKEPKQSINAIFKVP
jgi:Zinc knuckle